MLLPIEPSIQPLTFVPTDGFVPYDAQPAYLMGMASGRDPGNIDWPVQVRAAALAVGVKLR